MATFPESADPKAAWVASQWPHDRPLISCRFEPTGQFAFSGSEDNVIERFKLADGTKVNLSGGHNTWVAALTFSKDGKTLISGGYDGKLSWWSALEEAPTLVKSFAAHGTQWVRSLDTSPDGTLVVSGGNDRMVRLWNLADGAMVREIAGHEKHVYSVAFHPDGKSVFSGDLGGVIRRWDLSNGQELKVRCRRPVFVQRWTAGRLWRRASTLHQPGWQVAGGWRVIQGFESAGSGS